MSIHKVPAELERADFSKVGTSEVSIVNTSGDKYLVYGIGAPGVGAGYGVGCFFINTATGKGYLNEGTNLVADFKIFTVS